MLMHLQRKQSWEGDPGLARLQDTCAFYHCGLGGQRWETMLES